jgi:IS30 family transposase
MIPIEERPADAEGREVRNHWEGDLVIGEQGKSAVGTLADGRDQT